jgi:Zn-dependent protease with chaperone function
MHLMMILIAVGVAWCTRLIKPVTKGSWNERWQRSLFVLVFPPLLLLSTAIAVICMGFQGKMLGIPASWLGYSLAVGFVMMAVFLLLKLIYQGYQSLRRIRSYQTQLIAEQPARILKLDFPYSAQIGFWNSELFVSQGLIDRLDREHLAAVLAHEQAHVYYRDNFWFFWLGWLRYLTAWLPHTKLIWQELLLLRELRADRKAAQQVDPLLLAESLLTVVRVPLESSEIFCANFGCNLPPARLSERIDFMLAEPETIAALNWHSCSWSLLLFVPLFTIPFHY